MFMFQMNSTFEMFQQQQHQQSQLQQQQQQQVQPVQQHHHTIEWQSIDSVSLFRFSTSDIDEDKLLTTVKHSLSIQNQQTEDFSVNDSSESTAINVTENTATTTTATTAIITTTTTTTTTTIATTSVINCCNVTEQVLNELQVKRDYGPISHFISIEPNRLLWTASGELEENINKMINGKQCKIFMQISFNDIRLCHVHSEQPSTIIWLISGLPRRVLVASETASVCSKPVDGSLNGASYALVWSCLNEPDCVHLRETFKHFRSLRHPTVKIKSEHINNTSFDRNVPATSKNTLLPLNLHRSSQSSAQSSLSVSSTNRQRQREPARIISTTILKESQESSPGASISSKHQQQQQIAPIPPPRLKSRKARGSASEFDVSSITGAHYQLSTNIATSLQRPPLTSSRYSFENSVHHSAQQTQHLQAKVLHKSQSQASQQTPIRQRPPRSKSADPESTVSQKQKQQIKQFSPQMHKQQNLQQQQQQRLRIVYKKIIDDRQTSLSDRTNIEVISNVLRSNINSLNNSSGNIAHQFHRSWAALNPETPSHHVHHIHHSHQLAHNQPHIDTLNSEGSSLSDDSSSATESETNSGSGSPISRRPLAPIKSALKKTSIYDQSSAKTMRNILAFSFGDRTRFDDVTRCKKNVTFSAYATVQVVDT